MMGRKLRALLAAVALALAGTGIVQAEDELTYSFTFQGASDYIFRGLSYTEGRPALQNYTEFDYSIFYAAIWASRVDYLEVYGPWEFDVFLGARPVTGPITWDVGVWYYMYGSQDYSLGSDDLDYVELKLGASIAPVKNMTLSLTGYYTPDQDLAVVETKTIEGAVSYELPKAGIFTPTVGGVLGWAGSGADGFWLGEKDYWYWNTGVKLSVEKFFMDLRYWDTTIDHESADARFVFTAGVTVP